jgi:hypothetical protein
VRRLVQDYSWVEEEHDLAWTVAAIRGRSADDVVAAYKADGDAREVTVRAALAERAEHFDDYGLLQLLDTEDTEDTVVAIEPNGWAGAEIGMAEQLSSRGGYFFAVYWSPSGSQIIEARDGRLVGRFDPAFLGESVGVGDLLPGWVEPEDFPLDHVEASSLAALERRAGVRLARSLLDTPLPTYRLR